MSARRGVLSCNIHGELDGSVCEPCDVRRIAEGILDSRRPDVPIPRAHKTLLARYALRALNDLERKA